MREIPIIRALLQRRRITVRLFVHPQHLQLAQNSISESFAQVYTYPSGVSLNYKRDFDIDIRGTMKSLIRYILQGGWLDHQCFRKAIKARRPILVVNDFLPLVPLYARISKIPILGIYNYALRETTLGQGLFRRILSWGVGLFYPIMYRMCQEMLVEQIDGIASKETLFKYIPLVARDTTRSCDEVRQSLSANGRPLVFLSLGGNRASPTEEFLKAFRSVASSGLWQFIILPRDKEEFNTLKESYPQFLYGSSDWVETQDVIAAVDLVIARAGFTTVAETIKACVPLLLWHLETHPEIRETENVLLNQKLAAGVLYPEDNTEQIQEKIKAALSDTSLKQRLSIIPTKGAEQAADLIIKQLELHSS